ncbi:MAG: hypothetical protein ACREIN_00060 [Candidatus Methylomirabilaceae bacterium]
MRWTIAIPALLVALLSITAPVLAADLELRVVENLSLKPANMGVGVLAPGVTVVPTPVVVDPIFRPGTSVLVLEDSGIR